MAFLITCLSSSLTFISASALAASKDVFSTAHVTFDNSC
jgi:hypothetical protein